MAERVPPGESFLARRARLKADNQRAAREARSRPEPVPPPVESPPEPAPPVLTDADMPPLDELDAGSDFAQFLSEGVSDALRRAALNKLFHLPEFNVLDGLNDYDEDYTKFEKLGDIMTYTKRRMQAQQEARDEAAARAAAGDVNGPDGGASPADAESRAAPEERVAEERSPGEGTRDAATQEGVQDTDAVEDIEDDGDLHA